MKIKLYVHIAAIAFTFSMGNHVCLSGTSLLLSIFDDWVIGD